MDLSIFEYRPQWYGRKLFFLTKKHNEDVSTNITKSVTLVIIIQSPIPSCYIYSNSNILKLTPRIAPNQYSRKV